MYPLREMPSNDPTSLLRLYRRRAQHGLIVCADARNAEYPMHPDYTPQWGCLSIMAVSRGHEEYRFAKRALTVDDDAYLVVDGASRYSYKLRSHGRARCLMVCFPAPMLAAAEQAREDSGQRMLEGVSEPTREPRVYVEHLSAHDDSVSPELRAIETACLSGITEGEWYAQQMGVLLQRLIAKWYRLEGRLNRIGASRQSTRRELASRVALVTDRIHQDYRSRLDLKTLAGTARLSPFHLLRVFKQFHGVTPQEFLQQKRVRVARQLLSHTRLPASRVAALVGFESRASLHRWVVRVVGQSPGSLRTCR